MAPSITTNTLFYGDNLDVLHRYISDESVDLVYLDPPFNSNRAYNIFYKDEHDKESESQIMAFTDTWKWGKTTEHTYLEIVTQSSERVSKQIGAFREALGPSPMMAYLVMMAARLIELHRVLKLTGSLYLHCDPTASHYLKIVLDTIFGPEQFLAEIVWKRTSAHSSAKRPGPVHDIVLFYSRSALYTWNPQYQPYDDEYIENFYRHDDGDGRRYQLSDLMAAGTRRGSSGLPWRGIDPNTRGNHWKYTIEKLEELDSAGRIYWPAKIGGVPRYKRYLDEMKGIAIQDIWNDIPSVSAHAAERLGYATQKPLALLERIINASSNPGDVVLDPFCGCGTAVAAAQKLNRQWLGIDITHLAITLQKYRLEQMYPGIHFKIIGEPTDVGSARALAMSEPDGRYQFQWWALSLVQARPFGGEAGGSHARRSDGILGNSMQKKTREIEGCTAHDATEHTLSKTARSILVNPNGCVKTVGVNLWKHLHNTALLTQPKRQLISCFSNECR